ncbi:MAG: hypothetical protein DRJ05_11030 [Bacteroidetes bacterium]|nr:MAG: hypothetical protein DRJ05_11030 [Bacteroidota bacterium]
MFLFKKVFVFPLHFKISGIGIYNPQKHTIIMKTATEKINRAMTFETRHFVLFLGTILIILIQMFS